MKLIMVFVLYLIFGYLVGKMLGFCGIVDILLFPLTVILKFLNRKMGGSK